MTPLQPDTFYHIYNRANGRENLFDEKQNYHFFLEKYKKYISPIAETWAYCLMPNHFHLLVEIRSEEELKRRRRRKTFPKFETLEKLVSRQFANLFSSYTQAFHKLYQRTGSLFQKNFKRKEIDSGEYLTEAILYIHTNPVHHGVTDTIDDRSHSSYPDVVYGKNEYIDLSALIDRFGTKEQFVGCHKNKTAWELGSEITLEEV